MKVIPILTSKGHEIFAVDFLGHGMSDKPIKASTINFSLHMRTLEQFIRHLSLEDAIIVAHDWGGCVATCAAATLCLSSAVRIVLLNSFFPPRPQDITLNSYSLYILWFLSTGILDGYMSESSILRFMAPSTTHYAAHGYEVPYTVSGVASKASVTRFAHMVPGFPDFFLSTVRHHWLWLAFEGLCGPEKFTNFAAQERVAELGTEARKVWSECGDRGWKAMVIFGKDDPLLVDFKQVLEDVIDQQAQVRAPVNGWIYHAGHYPTEERPVPVCDAVDEFIKQTA